MKYKKLSFHIKSKLAITLMAKITNEASEQFDLVNACIHNFIERENKRLHSKYKVKWDYKYRSHEIGLNGSDFMANTKTIKILIAPDAS